ncbi:MAG: creatininase family protein [Candidatus Latescibacteria bacterium]|jgi:creatinine amidohydrolase|nr:creatininase family protein [Candidatus Latescibacterota bacterium]
MSTKKTRRNFFQSITASGLATGLLSSKNAFAKGDAPLRPSYMNPEGDRYIDPRNVLLYECTRREIRERINSGQLKAAIIPTGSTEHHNEHIAMVMDIATSLLISQHAALKVFPQAIVTTPVAIGYSPYWMERQGTLTLRKDIFLGVVYDICCSMKTHGIDTILIVNGHGGNVKPLKEAAPDFSSELNIKIEACSYWDSFPKDRWREFIDVGIVAGHAGEFETSIALAAFPERVHRVTYEGTDPYKWDVDRKDLERVGYYKESFDTPESDRSNFEESKHASAEKGERIIAHAVNWLANKLQKMIG